MDRLEDKLVRADYDIALSLFEDSLPFSLKFSLILHECPYLNMYGDLGFFKLMGIVNDAKALGWRGGSYPVSLKCHEIEKGEIFTGFVYLFKEGKEIGAAGYVEIDKENKKVKINGAIYASHNNLPERAFNELRKRLEKLGRVEVSSEGL